MATVLSKTESALIDAYWRAANYLSVGQIYRSDNPMLREPLKEEHIKPRLLGHWGTTPGLNFIYAHLNRLIKKHDLDMIYITGPGHGGPGLVANAYLEGTYSEVYPGISQDLEGMKRLFTQFSFPGGIQATWRLRRPAPSTKAANSVTRFRTPTAPRSTIPTSSSLQSSATGKRRRGRSPRAGIPTNSSIRRATAPYRRSLHLNGYKIANPTVLARISHEELELLLRGYGYAPHFVEGHEPALMHELMATTLETVIGEIRDIQANARKNGFSKRPIWPMIVMRTPKGWTCPKEIDGKKEEGYWRSHQVPMSEMRGHPEHVRILETWMKSYRPEELFDDTGRLKSELAALPPQGTRRMSANPHANGGALLRDLRLPNFSDYAVDVPSPGAVTAEATRVMGQFLRDVMKLNLEQRNFRLFSPDENNSNRWQDVLEVTNRAWVAETFPYDDHLAPDGRVMEMLSEHQCQGWLEGYLLTGRHGFFSCYEAFIHIVDFMLNQHAKWLKVCNEIKWRRPIASLNYLLSSHVWRQDHNGFSHQDPGFIDHVMNKKAEVVRIYLPPDANCLLSVTDHCLKSRNYVNVVVAGKQPSPQWLTMDEAIKHCEAGLGIFPWASNDRGAEPDVVMACCGDVPTLETLAAVSLLREHAPELKIRVVNVVDLMTLQPASEHPHGLPDRDFDALFTVDKPIIFAFHGYPWLIHRLTYKRTGHDNIHVRGYKEEGTTTTPFDMCVINDLDRFHLVSDVIDRVPQLGVRAAYAKQAIRDKLIDHREYICRYGDDMPEIKNWTWGATAAARGATPTAGDNV